MSKRNNLKYSFGRLVLVSSVPLLLFGCGKGEEEVVESSSVAVSESEEIDMESFRVSGDRVKAEPVLETEEREKRFIEQYETVDRPILMNTLRYILQFDKEHSEAFKGVRLITDKSDEDVKVEMSKLYKENLGKPMDENITKLFDIEDVYPYAEDDFGSYYQTVINVLQDEVLYRTSLYEKINSGIDKQDFNGLRKSGSVNMFRDLMSEESGLVEQVKPYIQEMDKLVASKRTELGMEMPTYTTLDDKVEKGAEYVVPKKATVQEIKSIEPTSDLYKQKEEQAKEEANAEDESEESSESNQEESSQEESSQEESN